MTPMGAHEIMQVYISLYDYNNYLIAKLSSTQQPRIAVRCAEAARALPMVR
jgi:hypothetical protein